MFRDPLINGFVHLHRTRYTIERERSFFFILHEGARPISQAHERGRAALSHQPAGLLRLFDRNHRQLFDQVARQPAVQENVGPRDGLGDPAGNVEVVVFLMPAQAAQSRARRRPRRSGSGAPGRPGPLALREKNDLAAMLDQAGRRRQALRQRLERRGGRPARPTPATTISARDSGRNVQCSSSEAIPCSQTELSRPATSSRNPRAAGNDPDMKLGTQQPAHLE